jgi:hypothetical protein
MFWQLLEFNSALLLKPGRIEKSHLAINKEHKARKYADPGQLNSLICCLIHAVSRELLCSLVTCRNSGVQGLGGDTYWQIHFLIFTVLVSGQAQQIEIQLKS